MGPFALFTAETVDGLFGHALRDDPARPLLTWYDDATGERVELSGTTLANWVAKTANLLVDGCGLGTGDRAAVLLPPHWQTAAVLLGCWSAGLSVQVDGSGSTVGSGPPDDVLFSTADLAREGTAEAVGGVPDRFALGLAPLGAPLRQVPDGYVDYVAEVRGHGDHFTAYGRTGPDDPARYGPATATHGDLCTAAVERATELGITPGARVLVDAAAHSDPLDWLLAPLTATASVVLCGHLERAKLADRVAAEQVTVQLTASPG